VKNAAGNFERASDRGVTEAAASVKQMPPTIASPSPKCTGRQRLPDLQLYLVAVPLKSPDAAKGKVLRDLLSWIVNSGESEVPDSLLCPAAPSVAEKVLKTIYSLQ